MSLSCTDPHSRIHPSLPNTCFIDLIVIPLPTWLFILLSPLSIIAYFRQRRNAAKLDGDAAPSKPRLLARIATAVYFFLALALLAMQSLQIARRAVAGIGIGLLPFTYVGILLAAGLHFLSRAAIVRGISALFWLLLAGAFAVNVAALVKEEDAGVMRRGQAGKYPLSDEVTDSATIVGVAFVEGVMEFVAR